MVECDCGAGSIVHCLFVNEAFMVLERECS